MDSGLAAAQQQLGMREGFDVGFEMSGAANALPSLIPNMNHGGRIAMLGLPSAPIAIDWATVVTRMLTLKGIYGREMFETWNAMDALLHTHSSLVDSIASIVTAEVGVADWRDGFAAAAQANGGKVMIDWTEI